MLDKKNGFTLVEILGVIVILGLLLILAFPSIIKQVKNTSQNIDKTTQELIFSSTKVFAEKNSNEYPIFKGNVYCITIQTLIASGELIENLTDTKTGNKIDLSKVVKMHIENEANIDYSIVDSEQCVEVISSPTFSCGNNFVDNRDNNTYKTVKIGDQCWFAEDLRYDCSREGYNNIGTGTSWSGTNNCGNQGSGYNGLLYQWPVAMKGSTVEGSQGLCPEGWHIPTDDEWKTLEMYLGMTQDEVDKSNVMRGTNEGNKLKGLTHSWCTGTSGCGESGFNASPASYRNTDGSLHGVGSHGNWWASASSDSNAWYRSLNSDNAGVYRFSNSLAHGRSVRCLWGQ